MKVLKMLITGLIIGMAIGMWFGMNMGKGKPILSNPFADENIPQKMKQQVGEKIEKLGGEIKGKVKEIQK
jgi:uncharacterized protein YneF (UPF0154 family)